MKYDIPERVFIVKKYYELKNPVLVQRAYRTKYKNKKAPSPIVISNIISVFEETGSVAFLSQKRKTISAKRIEAKNQLENVISEFPNLSLRKAATLVNVSHTLVSIILHDDLHLKPYKLHKWHKLEVHDYKKRVQFATWFLSLPQNDKFFFICSDEAYFHLTLPINKQNNRIWADSPPFEGVEVPLHGAKVLVWCAISAKKIYGPYFFESSVNQHNYLEMIKKYFWPKHLRTAHHEKHYFQQDGATPHTANIVQEWLASKFSRKFLSKLMWPPRSPDLNPCDFFLWGHLKALVYNPLPKTLEDLKANIEREIKNVPKEMLKSTFLNLEKRCKLILSAEGGHIE